ncbi:MAG: hypothetical protein JWM82_1887 [Myxococcales bacterium]|nr:hypothetical protein [Myxococcales bacterium]
MSQRPVCLRVTSLTPPLDYTDGVRASEHELAPRAPDDPALAAAVVLARWLDGRFLDPVLGLVLPGVGDLLSSALGVYPVLLAWRRRAPKALLARMLLNLAVDALGGSIPLIGDIWDFFFRAHTRNLALLQARADGAQIQARRSDTLVLVGAAAACVAALAVPIVVIVAIAHAVIGRR